MAARQSRDLRLLRCEALSLYISASRFRDVMISAIDSDTDSSFCSYLYPLLERSGAYVSLTCRFHYLDDQNMQNRLFAERPACQLSCLRRIGKRMV